jgi:hypothetical protein
MVAQAGRQFRPTQCRAGARREATGPGVQHRAQLLGAAVSTDWRDKRIADLEMEISVLSEAINTPEIEDFLEGVKREAAHQVKRWGYAHDRSKSAENWFWLVGYLAGKALRAAISGDKKKAQHHTISASAALYNWHTAITHDTTGAGVGQDDDLRATNPLDSQAMQDAA